MAGAGSKSGASASNASEELGDRLPLAARHVPEPVVTRLGDDRDDVLDFLLESKVRPGRNSSAGPRIARRRSP